MKKILALLLTMAIVCSLAACNRPVEDETSELSRSEESSVTFTEESCSSESVDETTSSVEVSSTEVFSEPHTHSWGHLTTEVFAIIGREGCVTRTCSGCGEVERTYTNNNYVWHSFGDMEMHWIIDNSISEYDQELLNATGLLNYVGGTYKGDEREGDSFSLSYDKAVAHLENDFMFSEETKESLKTDPRYNAQTDNFDLDYPSFNTTYGLLGYVHKEGKIYSVYFSSTYSAEGTIKESFWKAEVEYNLLEDKPNKYFSLVRVESVPSNIISDN